jgi:hypothetical protein
MQGTFLRQIGLIHRWFSHESSLHRQKTTFGRDIDAPQGSRRSQMHIENRHFADIPPRVATRNGFTALYHGDVVNHCPACGHTHWTIGRSTAECAFCETALPLAASSPQPMQPLFYYRGTKTAVFA